VEGAHEAPDDPINGCIAEMRTRRTDDSGGLAGLLAHTYAGSTTSRKRRREEFEVVCFLGLGAKKGGTNVLLFVPGGQ